MAKARSKKIGRGRPKTELPWEAIEAMATLKASNAQVLAFLEMQGIKITDDTLNNHARERYGCKFSDFVAKRFEGTKLKLVQKALELAFAGNVVSLIFCMKNLCGWSNEYQQGGAEDNSFNLNYKV